MKSKKIIFRNILIILSVCFFIFAAVFMIQNIFENKKVHVYSQRATVGKKIKNDSECSVFIEIPYRADNTQNAWFNGELEEWGAQYDIFINNNYNATLTNWTLKIILPCAFKIDSSWNGNFNSDFSDEKNSIVVNGQEKALNLNIQSKSQGKIGLVLYTSKLLETCDFELTYNLKKSILKNSCFIIFTICLILSLLVLFIYIIFNLILTRQKKNSTKTIEDLIKLISHFIDVRDPYTKEHSFHVGKYSKLIAEKMGFTGDDLQNIYYLGLLHDVGKVLIPNEILCKPGKLTDEEWDVMKMHTLYGAEVLEDFNHIPNVKDAVLYHHERYDGKGYMYGLSGEDIPLVARIICVADSYDAMATDRSYRKALSKEEILGELEKNKGKQFDPKIASIMIELISSGKI